MKALAAFLAVATLGLGVIATGGRAASGQPAAAARPNIVFILTDDQRWDSLTTLQTPDGPIQPMQNVTDLLAARGMTLTNYFLTDPLCCPSRASIMRGQYPHGTGVYSNDTGPYGGYPRFHAMGDDQSNVATWLHDAGYHTGMIGKYFNGYGPDQASIVPRGGTSGTRW